MNFGKESLANPTDAATELKVIGEWLGLRPGLDEPDHYDFKEAVAVGKFNTGDRTGYTTTTAWSKEELQLAHDPGDEVDPTEGPAPAAGKGNGHPGGQNAELIALAQIDEGSERMLRGFYKVRLL